MLWALNNTLESWVYSTFPSVLLKLFILCMSVSFIHFFQKILSPTRVSLKVAHKWMVLLIEWQKMPFYTCESHIFIKEFIFPWCLLTALKSCYHNLPKTFDLNFKIIRKLFSKKHNFIHFDEYLLHCKRKAL